MVPADFKIGYLACIVEAENKNMLSIKIFFLARYAGKVFFLCAEDDNLASDRVGGLIEDLVLHRIVKVGESIHDSRP